MALLLTDADIDRLLSVKEMLPAVEEMYRQMGQGQVSYFPRGKLHVQDGYLALMGGANHYQGTVGLKTYLGVKDTWRFYVLLFDSQTGELLLVTRANNMGKFRTGASSGVATKYLARRDAATVGVIGTGSQAPTQLEAVALVRPVRSIKAYSRNPQRRQRFAQEMSQRLGIPVTAVGSAQEAVEGADIVVSISSALEPVVKGEWLSPGATVLAAGNSEWYGQEVDEAAIRRSQVLVCDAPAQITCEAGELMAAVERGALRWEQFHSLGEVVAGRVPGRTSDDQIVLFKSLGFGPLDLVAAKLAYDKARAQGVGREFAL